MHVSRVPCAMEANEICFLPIFFVTNFLSQNSEAYNGKQYLKKGRIERTFSERSLERSVEKMLFDNEGVVTIEVTIDWQSRTRAGPGNGFVIVRQA